MNTYNIPNLNGAPTHVDGNAQPVAPVQGVDLNQSTQAQYTADPAYPYPQPVAQVYPTAADPMNPQPVAQVYPTTADPMNPQPVVMGQSPYPPQQPVYPQNGSQYYAQPVVQAASFQAPQDTNRNVPMPCAGVPDLRIEEAVVMLVLNILFPGIGTMVGGCMNHGGCSCCIVTIGIVQMFTTLLVFGYFWGIVSGVLAIVYARK